MIVDLFAETVAEHGERIAVICGGRQITYDHLDVESNKVARWMLSEGFSPRQRAGICGKNSVEWVIALLAILKARGVPVNLNHRYNRAELQAVLDDVDLRWLFHDDLPVMEEIACPEAKIVSLSSVNDRPEDPAMISWSGFPNVDPEYIIYTGGSTGAPKGVVWRQEDLIAAHLPPQAPPNTIACFAPLSHGTAQITLLAMIQNGGTLVLSNASFSAREMIRLINVHDAKVAIVTGDAMARPFYEWIKQGTKGKGGFVLASAGALLSEDVRLGLMELGVHVMDTYGSTETGRGGPSTGGRKFFMDPDFHVVTEDEHGWRIASPGEIGRIARRGHLPLGYLNDQKLTDEHFIEIEGWRWFVSRDMAEKHLDGTIGLLGRVDSCINTGGMKVWGEEVEEVIRSAPGVEDAIVYGRKHERWGEAVSCAYVGTASLEFLDGWVRAKLSGFKAPKLYEQMDQLPRTEAGKPDYTRLPR